MIGYLKGKILYCDGEKAIIQTQLGIGYEVRVSKIYLEGSDIALYISHIFRENDQELFGFSSLIDKKIFEKLLKVKGVGAKSAYSIIVHLGSSGTIRAIKLEDKKLLQGAPGIGPKAAAQIVLDLKGKMDDLIFWEEGKNVDRQPSQEKNNDEAIGSNSRNKSSVNKGASFIPDPLLESGGADMDLLIRDTLMACRELGFKDIQVTNLIREILDDEMVKSSEELLERVLKNVPGMMR